MCASACLCVCVQKKRALRLSLWWRYRYIAVLPGHQATINLHLYLAVPAHRAGSFRGLLAAHNNTQNAAGPCQPSLICGCGPGVEFSRCWRLDPLYSVGGLATSFGLHGGQHQWADTQPAITQRDGPASMHTGVPVRVHAHTHTP